MPVSEIGDSFVQCHVTSKRVIMLLDLLCMLAEGSLNRG